MIKVSISEKGRERTIIFSGDVGRWNRPILRDPTLFEEADYIVVESTYGDRPHRPVAESRQELADAVKEAVGRGGNVVIPSFALERAQDVLYDLRLMWEAGDMPAKRIFLDSPLAISITKAYEAHTSELNPKLVARLDAGEEPFDFRPSLEAGVPHFGNAEFRQFDPEELDFEGNNKIDQWLLRKHRLFGKVDYLRQSDLGFYLLLCLQ
jgi:Cft2 family RNA processing exonuclease